MSTTYSKLFAPAQMAATNTTYYTVPASPSGQLLRNGRVRVTNTTGSSANFTLYAVPSGGSAGVGNCFAYQVVVNPADYQDIDVPQMVASDFIVGVASAASTLSISSLDGVLQS